MTKKKQILVRRVLFILHLFSLLCAMSMLVSKTKTKNKTKKVQPHNFLLEQDRNDTKKKIDDY